jgi:long-subunit fatty acid transport protein
MTGSFTSIGDSLVRKLVNAFNFLGFTFNIGEKKQIGFLLHSKVNWQLNQGFKDKKKIEKQNKRLKNEGQKYYTPDRFSYIEVNIYAKKS